jgi:hypothetical protein
MRKIKAGEIEFEPKREVFVYVADGKDFEFGGDDDNQDIDEDSNEEKKSDEENNNGDLSDDY